MVEVWKDIENNDHYQVSNFGRIKNKKTKNIRRLSKDKDGYMVVTIDRKVYKVHRLVAKAFIKNDDINKCYINHKDECKTNNKVDNLEWCTEKYNANYGTRNERLSELQSCKKVIQYDNEGNILNIFRSLSYVNKHIENSGGICSALIYNKENRYFKNSFWFYQNEIFDNKRRVYKRQYCLYDMNDNVICDGTRKQIAKFLNLTSIELANKIYKNFIEDNNSRLYINNYYLTYNMV